jgi:hypothetical protein
MKKLQFSWIILMLCVFLGYFLSRNEEFERRMRVSFLAGVASLFAGRLALASSVPGLQSLSLDIYIVKEALRSYEGILQNFGNKGSLAPGTASGLFVASPNTANPDCKFRCQVQLD